MVKVNPQCGRNICKYTSDEGVVALIFKEPSELGNVKYNSPIRKCGKYVKIYFPIQDLPVMERCLTSLGIKKMQFKTTMRYHCIPIQIAKIKNGDTTKC